MVYVLTLGTGTRHDGGVGDRGDMVATYRSCHTSRDGDDAKWIIRWEYGDADRDENAECTP